MTKTILFFNTITLVAMVGIAILNAMWLRAATKTIDAHTKAIVNLLTATKRVVQPPEFICPRCGRESYNPDDRKNCYCGVCGFMGDC